MDAGTYRLIESLRAGGNVTTASLASLLHVSDRTVRKYVAGANEALAGVATVVSKRGHGYCLLVTDEGGFQRIMARESSLMSVFPPTPAGRALYLVDDLVNRADWITVGRLADILAVSDKTISSDLARVEPLLARFGLTLDRRPYRGIRVCGSEADKRLCLANLAIASEGNRLPAAPAADDETIRGVGRCVSDELRSASVHISSVAERGLVIHLYVALRRIERGCYVSPDAALLDQVSGRGEYEVASAIVGRLAERFGVAFPEQEVAYVAIQLASEVTIEGSGDGAGLVVSGDVWDVVSEMLDMVEDEFGFDLHGDLELRMSLARHVQPLSLRLRYHVDTMNPLVDETREHYPLAYLIALESSKVLKSHYGTVPSDEEIGYIALLYALGIERCRLKGVRKNILIVSDVGPSGTELLVGRCRDEFGDRVGEIRTCDIADLDDGSLDGMDYVFSTLPLGRALPVPVCQVSVFLDSDDVRKVRAVFGTEGGEHLFEGCFSRDLFRAHLACGTKQEVLDALCALVERHENLDGGFRQSVLCREEAARTAFGNLVAIPHPLEAMGARTVVAVGLLDRPIDWDGSPVRAVLLVSPARDGGVGQHEFDLALAELLSDHDLIDQIVSDQRYETLERVLGVVEGRRRASAPS